MRKALTTGTVFLMAILLSAALACGPAAGAGTRVENPPTQRPAAQPETPVLNPATQEPVVQPDAPARNPATQEPVVQPDTSVQNPVTQEPVVQPETPAASQPEMVEKPAPIDGVEFRMSNDDPPRYTLEITSGLPGGCVRFGGYAVSQVANNIHVSVTNLEPASPMLCTAIYGVHEGRVDLGSGFTPGDSYTVLVNGEVTNGFTARGPEDRTWVVKDSPIQAAELVILEIFPPQYRLNIISTLPRGSSCSRFDGYDVSRASGNSIILAVTHLEVAEDNVPCTEDLPVVETMVSLGSGFQSGEEYTVVINGQFTKTFKAQ